MKARTILGAIKFAQIGTMTGVLQLWDREVGRRYLLGQLTQIPGIPAKAAQLLGARMGMGQGPALVPHRGMPIEWIRETIENQSPKLARDLLLISPEGKAASIGQVHRAELKSGQLVAIKVMFPDIRQEMLAQLDVLLIGFKGLRGFGGQSAQVDIDVYRTNFETWLSDETDYRKEAANQEEFYNIWKGRPGVRIARPLLSYSTPGVLVQEFVDSVSLPELRSFSEAERLHCAQLVSDFFSQSLFVHHCVHSDFHIKNWGYRAEDRELVIYDFGSVLRLSTEQVKLLQNFLEMVAPTGAEVLSCLVALGFDSEKLEFILDDLPLLWRAVFFPLMSSEVFDPATWDLAAEIERVLGPRKWWFRTAGPPWFLLLMRAFQGVSHAATELGVPLPVRPIRETFSDQTATDSARFLKVSIRNNGTETVYLEMPARAVENLGDLVSDEVRSRICESGLNLAQIKAAAIAAGLPRKVLFESVIGQKSCRVWLD